jgi:hypothetical protein
MVKLTRRYLLTALMILALATIGFADAPPDPGGDPGTGGGTPVGGGSPIGSGFIITMTLAMAYGSRKVFMVEKEK